MIEIKKGEPVWIWVRLADIDSVPVTGVTHSQVVATIDRSDGTRQTLPLTANDWEEINFGAFSGTGCYKLLLPASVTDLPGPFMYAVKDNLHPAYIGAIKVVENEEVDTYEKILDIHAAQVGRWEIKTSGPDANRFIVYADDGVTVVRKYDLIGADGLPTFINPFQRNPV